jgi:crotonobetainyl-CoA:carnitine CoA-transferase CaiB-like acyl-CoA transferase
MLDVLSLPTHLDGNPVTVTTPPPLLGEHTQEVLTDLGMSVDEIARLQEAGAI